MRRGFFRFLRSSLILVVLSLVLGLLLWLVLKGWGVSFLVAFLVAIPCTMVIAIVVTYATVSSFRRLQGHEFRPLAEWATTAGWEAGTAGWIPIPEDGEVHKRVCELLTGDVNGVPLKVYAPYVFFVVPGHLQVGVAAKSNLSLPVYGRIFVYPRVAGPMEKAFLKLHELEETTQPVELESLEFQQHYSLRADAKSARLIQRIFTPDVIVRFEQAAARGQPSSLEYGKGLGTFFMEAPATPQGVTALVNEAVPLFAQINRAVQSP
jgi:hypothetical protein